MLTKTQINTGGKDLSDFLLKHFGVTIETATNLQLYIALASLSKEYILSAKAKTLNKQNEDHKTLHYISIEFLIGKSLKNNLWNFNLEGFFRDLLASYGKKLDDVYAVEKDAGLGNGGLGRLATCYLDSLARLGYKAYGHCIKYEFGLFNQKIVDGKQIEIPDEWLDTGSVWLEERADQAVEVLIGGTVEQTYSSNGLYYRYEGATVITAMPFDMMISGYNTCNASTLRLWEARVKNAFDIKKFDEGDYLQAMEKKTKIESINRVLYPSDQTDNGKLLRLLQQYFLVSATMQNIINNYLKSNSDIRKLPQKIAIHINDTHPVLIIPEMMRILMDMYRLGWDEAWAIVTKTVSYTNHTILSEALEVKKLSNIEKCLPRIAMIIKELDRRFRIDLEQFCNGDKRNVDSLAIINGNHVYMANLAIYASYAVNGVSKIHTHILKTRIFHNYNELYPNKILNITNGVTHRRWLCQSNPELNSLIVSLIGDKFYEEPKELEKLNAYINNVEVLNKLAEIKLQNKRKLAEYIEKTQSITVDPNARFDVQVKRIHEYKRQLLNVLKIIYLCNKIKENPKENVTPQVFIFAGKAASGYAMAKRIIKLINKLAFEVNNDPVISQKIKVVFMENYNVSLSEIMMPATEVSEQISLAGREASGTGNMKAVLNGALMMCTVDGANIEIAEKCGEDTVFSFGLNAEEVEYTKNRGYNAMEYYINNDKVRVVIDKLNAGVGGDSFSDIADYLLGHADYKDSYMCLADFESYINAHYKMDEAYQDKLEWNKKSLKSIAAMGYFSSDRSIEEYVDKIWKLQKNEK